MPTITVGLPVYNGEEKLEQSIESILSQSFTDLELLISDNASIDSTADLCQRLAKNDNRIRYVRQSTNIGQNPNFRYVLQAANGEYFTWHADDDFRSRSNIEENIRFLKDNPHFVGSTSPNCFEDELTNREKWHVFSLEQNTYPRLQRFLDFRYVSHGIYFSIFRKEVLLRIISQTSHVSGFPADWLAQDWFQLLCALLEGPIKRIDAGLITISRGGISQSAGNVSRLAIGLADRLFPLNRFSISSIRAIRHSTQLTPFQKTLVMYRLCGISYRSRHLKGL